MSRRFQDWLKHAFAIEGVDEPPTKEERQMIERLAREVVRRRMTTPALVMLESARPLNSLGAQAMHFFAPLMSTLFDRERYEMAAAFLARRDAVDLLCARIEELERRAERHESSPSPPGDHQ